MVRFVASAIAAVACCAGSVSTAAAKPRQAEPVHKLLRNQHFDLAEVRAEQLREDALLALPASPPPPPGADISTREWTPPAVELEMAGNGPTLRAGALGSRLRGVPKLVHVAIDWSF